MAQPLTIMHSVDSLPLSASSPSSIYTTTSSNTVPGIGALSGKFILGFGKMVLRGIENARIRKRLSHIRSLCPLSDDRPPSDIERVYDDLIELSRPGLYPDLIRWKALSLICEQIKISETRYLLSSLEKWPQDEKIIILCEILIEYHVCEENLNMPELGTIISLYEQTLDHLSTQNPARPNLLSKLTTILLKQFYKTEQLAPIDKAVLLAREALMLSPSLSLTQYKQYLNLSACLCARFLKTGLIADLEEAGPLCHQAIQLIGPLNLEKSVAFFNFAFILSTRFKEISDLKDLDMAIYFQHQMLKLQRKAHPARLKYLAGNLSQRFEEIGQLADLEEAVLLCRKVLELMPQSLDPESLCDLAIILSKWFDETAQLECLEEAIVLHRMVLHLLPHGHKNRSESLSHLANNLHTRFDKTSRLADLEEAVLLHRKVLELRPPQHPDRSHSLEDLATVLSKRFITLDKYSDLEEAYRLRSEASACRSSQRIAATEARNGPQSGIFERKG